MSKQNFQQIFSSNLKLLRKRKRKTQDDLAVYLGIPRSTVNNYENKNVTPKIDVLIAISEYLKISLDTLLKVDMNKLRESELSQIERGYDVFVSGSRLRILTTTVDDDGNENIELVPEKAKAGYMRGFADPDFIKELPTFKLPFLPRERKYRTFQIKGDSMLPIPENSWITGEFVQDWSTIKNGEAYIVLTLDEGIVFKVLENKLEADGKIKLFSLNTVYEAYELDYNQIKEIWKFVHFISNEIPEHQSEEQVMQNSFNRLMADVDKIKEKLKIN